jgi:hypothetical protein
MVGWLQDKRQQDPQSQAKLLAFQIKPKARFTLFGVTLPLNLPKVGLSNGITLFPTLSTHSLSLTALILSRNNLGTQEIVDQGL